MIWLDALKAHEGGLDDYRAHLEKRRAQAQQQQDQAASWEAAKEALGVKRCLDSLLADLTRSEHEEMAHAAYLRNGR